MDAESRPALSVVIAIVSDTTEPRARVDHVVRCLEGFRNQIDAPPTELIVPYHDAVDGIEQVIELFPEVRFLPVASAPGAGADAGRAHHDVLRAQGLLAAQGEIVALVEDHARPDEHWCAAVVAAHRADFAAIGGAMDNDVDRALNWAVYFCDFGRYQNPLPDGESQIASDANVSFKRPALRAIQSTWEESFREIIVNGELMARGERLGLSPEIVMFQNRRGLTLGVALRERFQWGRSYAGIRNALLSSPQRLVYALLAPLLPVLLTLRMTRTAWARRRRFGRFVRALPLVVLLQVSWSLGESVGYVLGGGE